MPPTTPLVMACLYGAMLTGAIGWIGGYTDEIDAGKWGFTAFVLFTIAALSMP